MKTRAFDDNGRHSLYRNRRVVLLLSQLTNGTHRRQLTGQLNNALISVLVRSHFIHVS